MLVIVSLHHYNHNSEGLLPHSLFRVAGYQQQKKKKSLKGGISLMFFQLLTAPSCSQEALQ